MMSKCSKFGVGKFNTFLKILHNNNNDDSIDLAITIAQTDKLKFSRLRDKIMSVKLVFYTK